MATGECQIKPSLVCLEAGRQTGRSFHGIISEGNRSRALMKLTKRSRRSSSVKLRKEQKEIERVVRQNHLNQHFVGVLAKPEMKPDLLW